LRQNYRNLSRPRGTAIIVALFVMSIVAAASVAMMSRLYIDIHRTEMLLNADQAYLYAEGSIAWAINQLTNDLKQQKPDQLVDRTPIISKMDEEAGFQIQSTINDAEAYFNINNLIDAEYENDFMQLLQAVNAQIDPTTAKKIASGIHNWVTRPQDNTSDNDYAKNNPPYAVPHQLMANVSELRLVNGMTATLYAQLKPYIIALPELTPININNAEIPVLMSLSSLLQLENTKMLIAYRQKMPFTNTQKFLSTDIMKNSPLPVNKITVTSRYFLVKTSVTVGEQRTILYTLLKRSSDNTKPAVTMVWQTKGAL
jgi:general secretion pathway protein K